MFDKINKLKNWQVLLILATTSCATFFTGLNSPFWNDDIKLIVNNPIVHSIGNIRIFFTGGTYYYGSATHLTGVYYRPLVTTIFSLIYTLFGAHTLAFHLLQLLLVIGCAFLLYLVFRYFFNPILAITLSLVFLVHPVSSQIIFAIPYTQDLLFFLFGILVIWLLMRFNSVKSLWLAALCLFLSLLSKETAFVFIGIALLYLFMYNRERLYKFLGIAILPVAAYLALKINAVGLDKNPLNAPIDKINLWQRLLTAPSIMQFYLTKFIFPWKLATGYYWVYPKFSIDHVLVPFIIDLAVIGLVIYLVIYIRKKLSVEQFRAFLFFSVWAAFGLLAHLQIIPLDMTACEIWFYFSMAGILGMLGVLLIAFQSHIQPKYFFIVAALIISLLAFRTALRGLDYGNVYTLARLDVSVSKDDYAEYTSLAGYSLMQNKFTDARIYAMDSIKIFPVSDAYSDLGLSLANMGDFQGAMNAYNAGLKLDQSVAIYENIGALTIVYGQPALQKQFLVNTLAALPNDSKLWMYLALNEAKAGDNTDAKVAINNASIYGQVNSAIYNDTMNNLPFTVTEYGKTIQIH